MGSGALKTLSSDEIPHYQFLHFFSHRRDSLEPRVGLLLGSLSVGSCDGGLFFVVYAPIVYYGLPSLARACVTVPLNVSPDLGSRCGAQHDLAMIDTDSSLVTCYDDHGI